MHNMGDGGGGDGEAIAPPLPTIQKGRRKQTHKQTKQNKPGGMEDHVKLM